MEVGSNVKQKEKPYAEISQGKLQAAKGFKQSQWDWQDKLPVFDPVFRSSSCIAIKQT